MIPKFNSYEFGDKTRRATVPVSDGFNSFKFLIECDGIVDGNPVLTLLWPDFSPEVYGKKLIYRIRVGTFSPVGLVVVSEFIVKSGETFAYAPFRFEGENYNEFTPLGWEYDPAGGAVPTTESIDSWYYVSITPVVETEDGTYVGDINYNGSQSAFTAASDFLIAMKSNVYSEGTYNFGVCVNWQNNNITFDDLLKQVGYMYNIPSSELSIQLFVYLSDSDTVYSASGKNFQGEDLFTEQLLVPYPSIVSSSTDTGSDFWNITVDDPSSTAWWGSVTDMEAYAWLTVVRSTGIGDEVRQLIGFRSSNIPVTQDVVAAICSDVVMEETINLEDMNNYPRIINQNVQEVVEMSSRYDSKANIVQPVFFRTHPTGNIVIHPAVTENISINLDFYKSAVDTFYIQIEGVVYPEIARTSAGVIFNIKGNLLPGVTQVGSYYILDQDENMVTNGLYQYEY